MVEEEEEEEKGRRGVPPQSHRAVVQALKRELDQAHRASCDAVDACRTRVVDARQGVLKDEFASWERVCMDTARQKIRQAVADPRSEGTRRGNGGADGDGAFDGDGADGDGGRREQRNWQQQ